jgi:hypothetical protein
MKRRLLLLALLLSTLAAVPTTGVPPVGTAPALPIAGEVTIHAEAGLHGIRLALPDVEGLAVDNELSTIDELYEGDYGLVQLNESGILDGDFCTAASLCPLHNIEALPGYYRRAEDIESTNGLLSPTNGCTMDTADGGHTPCPLDTSTLEVYIATDAEITFTLRFPQLDGAVRHEATGQVDGIYEEIPTADCPGDDCDRFEIGHKVRNIGTPAHNGFMRGIALARVSNDRLAGELGAGYFSSIGVMACAYPNYSFPNDSADPDDHPLGCDSTPGFDPAGDVRFNTNYMRTYYANPQTRAIAVSIANYQLDGSPQYAGFNMRNHTPVPGYDGYQNAWVVWFEQGIN